MADNLEACIDMMDEDLDWLMESATSVEKATDIDDQINVLSFEEKKEQNHFIKILKSEFSKNPVINGSNASGSVQSEDQLLSLIRKLKAFGFFFAIRTSRSYRSQRIYTSTTECRAMDHPCVVRKCIQYYCNAGHDKKEDSSRSNSQRIHSDCKAVMMVRQVCVLSSLRSQDAKKLKLKKEQLDKAIAEGQDEFWITISLPKVHKHPDGAVRRFIDPEVRATMHGLVNRGIRDPVEIRRKLQSIVKEDFAGDVVLPKADNTVFYPKVDTIYRQLFRVKGWDLQFCKEGKKRKSTLPTMKKNIVARMQELIAHIESCSDIDVIQKCDESLKEIDNLFSKSAT